MTPAEETSWRRVHPVSPLLSGGGLLWVIFTAVVFYGGREAIDLYQSLAEVDSVLTLVGTVGILLLVLALVAALSAMSWWFYRYRITEDTVEIRSGWIMRNQRRMRLDRMQAVDIQQPLLARLFGFASLNLEAADAGESAMELKYVKFSDAQALRTELLRAASGAQDTAPASADISGTADHGDSAEPVLSQAQADEHAVLMVKVPTSRLIWSTVLDIAVGFSILIPFLAMAAVLMFLFFDSVRAMLAGLGVGIVSSIVIVPVMVLFSLVGPVLSNYGFTVYHTTNGLKNEYGLTTKTTQTIPPGRVQAVKISQPWIWRKARWYRMSVTTAGYGVDDAMQKSTVLPVGTLDDVYRVLSVISPNPGVPHGPQLIEAGFNEHRGSQVGYINSPRRARLFMPWQVRRHGFHITPALLLIRTGRLARAVNLIPHDRIQSTTLAQGPVQRWLKVSTMSLQTSDGPVNTTLRHMDTAVALELFRFEAEISAFARRVSQRDAWMADDELRKFNRATREAQHTLETAPEQRPQPQQRTDVQA